MWRGLVDRGLRRCLFGVESGVDSILERFNKETLGEQNALAIRTLSALGVPTRFTYISFDQLMTFEELKATYDYQGRTDLLLTCMPELSTEEIVAGVADPDWVATHSTGQPFHSAISYMLVSMECLIGAAYTKQAQAAGLTGEVRPSMGRVDARFADWRIGVASEWAQLWVDRNFALDYTFKSLEKILDGKPRQAVRETPEPLAAQADSDRLSVRLRRVLDAEIKGLAERMGSVVEQVCRTLPPEHGRVLSYEHWRWARNDQWRSINAADPCGT
jgi:hypothetical protein